MVTNADRLGIDISDVNVRMWATAAGCSTWGQWPAWATWVVRTLANRGATTSRISSGDEKVWRRADVRDFTQCIRETRTGASRR